MGNDQSNEGSVYEEPAQSRSLDDDVRQLKELTLRVQQQIQQNAAFLGQKSPAPSKDTPDVADEPPASAKEKTQRRRRRSIATESGLMRLHTPSKDDAETFDEKVF